MNRRDDELKRAITGYDGAFEERLTDAIMTAVIETSRIENVLALRTGETAAALTHVLAVLLAMSPAAVRSPAAIRSTADGFRKKLTANVRSAERNPAMREFLHRTFNHSNRAGGSA